MSRSNSRMSILCSFALLMLAGPPLFGGGSDQAIPSTTAPRLNQVGYPTWAVKTFLVAEDREIAPGAPFEVRDAGTGEIYFHGRLALESRDETPRSGERVLTGDFSALRTAGRYDVVVAGRSSPVTIGDGCYRGLWRDALRCFRLIRAGVAIDDQETGIAHSASHTGLTAVAGSDERRDVTGGWYNAGDFGRWVHMAAISCSYFLHLQECRGGVPEVSLGLPDPTPGSTALLREARWGIEWMLKMQNADGSVMHKVDSQPHLEAWGRPPQDDPFQHFVRYRSSIDAGVFTAVMYQASRAFRDEDAALATRCTGAADRAWDWLREHRNVPHQDPYYRDSDAASEWLWAACERLMARNESSLGAEVREILRGHPLPPVTWSQPAALGVYGLARHGSDPALRAVAIEAIAAQSDRLVERVRSNAYGVALPLEGYVWECGESVLHSGCALAMAYDLTGRREYLDAAVAQLDWMLGHNGLGYALVSGQGQRGVRSPYHWALMALGKLMPGWASGGPNRYGSRGADKPLVALQEAGTPPERCFLDYCSLVGSWASNEGETSENAALVFLSGMLLRGPYAATEASAR